MERLIAANAAVGAGFALREPGMTANSPTVDGKAIPSIRGIPRPRRCRPTFRSSSATARTEETLYDRPTPEKLALDEAGLRSASSNGWRRSHRVIAAFRECTRRRRRGISGS